MSHVIKMHQSLEYKEFVATIKPDIKAFIKKINSTVLKKYDFSINVLYKDNSNYNGTAVMLTFKINKTPDKVQIVNDTFSAGLKPVLKKGGINLVDMSRENGGKFIVELRQSLYNLIERFLKDLTVKYTEGQPDDVNRDNYSIESRVRFTKKEFNVDANGNKMSSYDRY